MPKTKLIDVAELAGVSKSTVSQYLNGRFDYMSEKTKERVRLAISELDYVPNPIARSLKTDKTKTIGVIVRDIIGYDTSHTIRAIDDYCKKSGYKVLIYNSDFDSETEASALEALYQLRVDGVIIASSGKNTALIDKYISKGLSVVYFQLEHEGNEKNIVISDYRKAAFEATEYLIKNGHNRICFLTQDFKEVKSREERYLGYTEALKKYNLPENFILNVGTIEKRKNLATLVEAIGKTHTQLPLVVIGKKTDYLDEVWSKVESGGIEKQVAFLENVSFLDLPAIYQMANLFVYPSFFEGFGIPILEALYSKIPVISATGSCLEEAGGEHSIYVDPNNSDELAEKIDLVIESPDLQIKMKEEGYKFAQNFSSDKQAKSILELYKKI